MGPGRHHTAPSPAPSHSSYYLSRSESPTDCVKAPPKRSRSVATLTPAQLARKRANDRETQRVIRTRTREHIERLERELQELRNDRDENEVVKELLRCNKALEEEIRQLREQVGASQNTPPYANATATSENLNVEHGLGSSPGLLPGAADLSPPPSNCANRCSCGAENRNMWSLDNAPASTMLAAAADALASAFAPTSAPASYPPAEIAMHTASDKLYMYTNSDDLLSNAQQQAVACNGASQESYTYSKSALGDGSTPSDDIGQMSLQDQTPETWQTYPLFYTTESSPRVIQNQPYTCCEDCWQPSLPERFDGASH